VEVFAQEHFISLLGGKWTTYRQMAQDAVDAVQRLLHRPHRPSSTPQQVLPGLPVDLGLLLDRAKEEQTLPATFSQNLKNWVLQTDCATPEDVLRRRSSVQALSHAAAQQLAPQVEAELARLWERDSEESSSLLQAYQQKMAEVDARLDQAFPQ